MNKIDQIVNVIFALHSKLGKTAENSNYFKEQCLPLIQELQKKKKETVKFTDAELEVIIENLEANKQTRAIQLNVFSSLLLNPSISTEEVNNCICQFFERQTQLDHCLEKFYKLKLHNEIQELVS